MLRGLDPWWPCRWKEKTPAHCSVFTGNITGANLTLDKLRIAANRCHCNKGGNMTLTELSITIWHDLAAPTLVGIATGLFLGWWHRRK